MDTTCMIEDADGTVITDGVSEDQAHNVAQRLADERGESVYLWLPGAEEAEEIDPAWQDACEADL